jgi:hypothetical protein
MTGLFGMATSCRLAIGLEPPWATTALRTFIDGLRYPPNMDVHSQRLLDGSAAVKNAPDLLPGTLDMLVLATLTRGPLHAYGIAQRVNEPSQTSFTWARARSPRLN